MLYLLLLNVKGVDSVVEVMNTGVTASGQEAITS